MFLALIWGQVLQSSDQDSESMTTNGITLKSKGKIFPAVGSIQLTTNLRKLFKH